MKTERSPAVAQTNFHGTTLSVGSWAAMIIGPPGTGKSDLALRCLTAGPSPLVPHPARLISDDQTLLQCRNGQIYASPPATIRGKLEVRGLGLIDVDVSEAARLVLIVDLAAPPLDRIPPEPLPTVPILGQPIPRIGLAAFEPSASAKLLLALAAQGQKLASGDSDASST
jgi:HPr kinase/phosphorylase